MSTGCVSFVDDNCGSPLPAEPGNGEHFLPQNFSYETPPITPTLDIDVQSFTSQTSMDPTELGTAMTQAISYWNSAGANFVISTKDIVCSDSDSSSTVSPADRACIDFTDALSTVLLDHGTPGTTGTTPDAQWLVTGKDSPDKHKCLVAKDIVFKDTTDDLCTKPDCVTTVDIGTWHLNWVVWDTEGSDLDCTDGLKDKPFYDTFVHELGHFVGLDHSEAALTESVMNITDCSGCNWTAVGAADQAAVEELYP